MFREKGEMTGNENITLMDAPRDRPMSAELEDEGIPTFNKEVISKGIFINPLSNNELGETTGNAGWITPRPWNLDKGRRLLLRIHVKRVLPSVWS